MNIIVKVFSTRNFILLYIRNFNNVNNVNNEKYFYDMKLYLKHLKKLIKYKKSFFTFSHFM